MALFSYPRNPRNPRFKILVRKASVRPRLVTLAATGPFLEIEVVLEMLLVL